MPVNEDLFLANVYENAYGSGGLKMEFNYRALNGGVSAGHARCIRFIEKFEPSRIDLGATLNLLAEVLKRAPNQWHPRAVDLFSEIVTVGAISRSVYEEPALTVGEVTEYLGLLEKLFNSFTHK